MGIHTFFKTLPKLELIERCPGEFMFSRSSVAAHSFKVTQYAQFLGEVEEREGNTVNWKTLYEKALNHDFSECFTGDIKTPVKYWTPEIKDMLKTVEESMLNTFIETEIPQEFQQVFKKKFKEGKDSSLEGRILAAADKMDLLYEAWGELKKGNTEPAFVRMYKESLIYLKTIKIASVDYFMTHVLEDLLKEELVSSINIKMLTEEVLKNR